MAFNGETFLFLALKNDF